MSRADYLSKYLGETEKKRKKKSKKSHATNIVIAGQPALPVQQPDAEEEPSEVSLRDPEDEYAPVGVEAANAPKPNKGFKRIDNGQVITAEKKPDPGAESTVYRDSSGRIVDLAQRRNEIKLEKERKEREELLAKEKISVGEADAIRIEKDEEKLRKATRLDVSTTDAEYVQHRKAQVQFDDPLLQFGETKHVPQASETGRPVYQGGTHPANRFEIKAGYFWDGIDRSNGFENKIIRKRSENYVAKFTARASKESYTEYDFD